MKFAQKIQQVGSLLVRRMRKYEAAQNMLNKQLLGNFMPNKPYKEQDVVLLVYTFYFLTTLDVNFVATSFLFLKFRWIL